MIKGRLTFKNLPKSSSLIGWTAEKDSGCIRSPKIDYSHMEILGSFELTGTGVFKNVKGSGIAMIGATTGFAAYHLAWVNRWPL